MLYILSIILAIHFLYKLFLLQVLFQLQIAFNVFVDMFDGMCVLLHMY